MAISEVILCKFGEVVLKGANRQNFESALVKELRRRASPYGSFKIYFKQSTVYVEPQDDFCDIDGMYESAMKTFGIAAIGRAAVCEKNMDDIRKRVLLTFSNRRFKTNVERSGDRNWLQINVEVAFKMIQNFLFTIDW